MNDGKGKNPKKESSVYLMVLNLIRTKQEARGK